MVRTSSRARPPVCGYTFREARCRRSGSHFCEPRAARAEAFFVEVLVHTKGDYARRPFILADWELEELIRPLFGQMVWDPERRRYVRRYRIVWLELARKNGKSEILAAIALLLLIADDEEGAEIYGAAKDRDQAAKVWQVAERMVRLSPLLAARLRINKLSKRIYDEQTGSWYEIITADAAGELGHNPHGVVFDEVLTQKSDALWNALRTGMDTRAQPLMVAATTAGNDPTSFAAVQHAEMVRVAEDPSRSPHTLVVMRNTPKDADPWDERNWFHANPALGDFKGIRGMREQALEARNDPTKENAFRQFQLNQWVQQVTRWIVLETWDANAGDKALLFSLADELMGHRCFGGLDLAATTDMVALNWFFPSPEGEHATTIWRFFTNEAAFAELSKHQVELPEWRKAGLIAVNDGDVVDLEAVHAQIAADAERFDVAEMGVDRWNSLATMNFLNEVGIPNQTVGQGYALSEALKRLMRLLKTRGLAHAGNPVARWHADSAEVKQDPQENIQLVKPNRERSSKRIDGIAALAMAIDGWIRRGDQGVSVYESHGLEVIG